MKNVFFCFFLSLIISPSTLISQQNEYDPTDQILPPSPTAAALGKYGDIPVSLHTGIPNISIPLHVLEGTGINVPISLSYHAQGVKVDEISSWVGLGWSLNAGGVITRTVRGKPDRDFNGFFHEGGNIPYPIDVTNSAHTQFIEDAANGYVDTQPDLYSFNFAGYSGKFVFDGNGNIRTIPHQNIKIELATNTDMAHFIITTPDGMVYKFGGNTTGAKERSSTKTTWTDTNGALPSGNEWTFDEFITTGYYITKIHNPNTNSSINFSYESHYIEYELTYSEKHLYQIIMGEPSNLTDGCYPGFLNGKSFLQHVISKEDRGVHLKTITSPYGSIEFVSDGVREDILVYSSQNPNRLKTILVKGKNGGTLKEFRFEQDFWSAQNDNITSNAYSKKRMYLKNVQEFGSDGSSKPPYIFKYHKGEELPTRLSFAQDHWGFYNGATDNEYFTPDLEKIPPSNGVILDGADREPNAEFSKYGILEKITYPTGGSSKIFYEGNETGVCQEKEIRTETDVNAHAIYTHPGYTPPYSIQTTFNIDQAQYVRVDYEVIMTAPVGAKVTLTADDPNSTYTGNTWGGYSAIFPTVIDGSSFIYLPEGDYTIEAYVENGPPTPPTYPYNDGEQAHISVNYTTSGGFTVVENLPFGGNRVQRIEIDDKNGNISTKKYEYDLGNNQSNCSNLSSGIIMGQAPRYFEIDQYLTYDIIPSNGSNQICQAANMYMCTRGRAESSSLQNISGSNGEIMGYREVKEVLGENGENGYTHNYYKITKDQSPEPNNIAPHQFLLFAELSLNTPWTDMSWQSGYLTKQETYDANGNIVKQLINDYNFGDTTNQQKIKAMVVKQIIDLPCNENIVNLICDNTPNDEFVLIDGFSLKTWGGGNIVLFPYDTIFSPCFYANPGDTIFNYGNFLSLYAAEYYDVISQWVYLNSTTEILDGVTKTTNFDYDSDHLNMVESTFQNSNGEERKTKYFYAPDVYWSMSTEESDAVDEMLLRHMIGVPLRTETYVDGTQASGLWMEYKIEHNLVVPQNYHSYEGGWYKEAEVTDYTPDGLIHKVDKTGWSTETYDWQDGRLTHKNYEEHDQSWDWYYDTHRQLKSATGIDGQEIYYDYDGLLRLETIKARVDVSGTPKITTTYTYNYGLANNGENYVHTHQHFDGFDDQYTKQTFDGLGRDLNTIRIGYSPSGGDVIVNELVYNQYGRVAQKTHLPGSLTSIGYEPSPLNRPTSETFPDGYSVSTSYGNSGNYYKITVTDENGNPTETITDIIGRTERTIDAKNGKTTYDYDKRDNLIQVINPLGQAYDYTYDVHNRLRQKKIPGADCQEFVYDLRDLVIATQDGNLRQKTEDNWIANEYDVYGRVRKTGFYSFPTNTSCTITPGGTPPSIPSNFIPIANKMLTENVYDAYGSGQKPSGCPTGDMDIILKGRLTYTKARVMEEGNLTSTVETGFCYDEYGREIGSEVFASPHGTDKYDHTFDIADHLKSTNRNYSGGVQYTKQYDYDHGGRLAETKFNMGGLGNPNPVTLAKNSYNNRDELIGKALGGAYYNVGQNSVFQYLQNVNYSFNVRGFLTAINQTPFSPTSPFPTCETPVPPIPPGNPPNDCAECGDEIVTVQELLKLRWEQNLNVDCYIPCDCELRCDTDCDDEDATNPDVPTDNPSASELNLPTYLVQIQDCDGDTSFVLADSLINVYGDYSMIGMIELNDDDNQEFRVGTTTGDQTVGLDGLLTLVDNGEVTDVKTDKEGNCDECITDAPDCEAGDETAQNNYLNSLGSNPAPITYPTLLHRVRLCDGSEVYLFEEELNNLPRSHIILQTIQIENSSQIITQVLSDGCTTTWTVSGFMSVRTFNSEWNLEYYIPCDEQDCSSTLQTETVGASSVSRSFHYEQEFGLFPTNTNLVQVFPGSSNALVIDGVNWVVQFPHNGASGHGEVEFYLDNGAIPGDVILNYEITVAIPYVSDHWHLLLGLYDGDSFIPINGGQDYLSYHGSNPIQSGEVTIKPDALPSANQVSNMRLVMRLHSETSTYHIDGISLDIDYIDSGSCVDACQADDPVCSPEELEAQQASLDSIETLWNETPLSDLELPTKLYRVKLCDGSEVYLLQHELSLLEGNYLILQSIDINELSETHLMKKEGVDGEALDANDLFALKLKYYNGDKQISNTVGKGYGNGNIATQYWQVAGRDRQAYGYRYDDLDRITHGKYADISENDVYYNKDHYSVDLFNAYDAIGNITRLSREGAVAECITPDSNIVYSYGNIDRLQYQYNADKSHLIGVTEASINRGFKATAAYTYDANGNLISDSGKGITEIKYNHLNLPYEVVFGTGEIIRWMYDATGKKLRKNVIGGNETNEVNYIDGIEKDVLNGDFIYHEEGRVYLTAVLNSDDPSGDPLIPAGTMAYTIKDHLGNARVTFADLDGNGWITIEDNPNTQAEEPQELIQENHYYPFGMNMVGPWYSTEGSSDKYQYNGKELNTEFDLGWNDYGARWYDAAIGRWNAIDPLAEDYISWSPYNYVMNNPLKFIDPDGRQIWISHKGKDYLYEGGELYLNGSQYTGKLKGFLKKTVNALNTIGGEEKGNALILELQGSKNNFTIEETRGDTQFKENNVLKAHKNQYLTDPALQEKGQILQERGLLDGGSGGTIYFNTSGELLPTTDGLVSNSTIDLVHEMFHASDANNGLMDERKHEGISRNEWQAVYNENIMRGQLGLPLRTHYKSTSDPSGVKRGGTGTRMLTPDNKPIQPTWY